MDIAQLQKQFVDVVVSIYRQNFLDDQYAQLRQLEDESNPDFVVEVVMLFFEDSERIIDCLTTAMQQQIVDFKQVDAIAHQFKGSTSSVGAQRVKNACLCMRTLCEQENLDGCLQCLQLIRNEYFLVKSGLEAIINMEQQIMAAGGTIPAFSVGMDASPEGSRRFLEFWVKNASGFGHKELVYLN
ncbi:unnamed protein product [Cuscuta europaea]|uniref:Histidine-containing phosphotransfer protein n=1 Tax=Cuscuta europaea TaxID=41803 RepID=A0A9P0ZU69_CUSEU|nr:unnamed protein product [Cuscuta europaea]